MVNAKNATFGEINIGSGSNTALSLYSYGLSGSTEVAQGGITARGISGGGQIYTLLASNRNTAGTLTLDAQTGDSFTYNGRLH